MEQEAGAGAPAGRFPSLLLSQTHLINRALHAPQGAFSPETQPLVRRCFRVTGPGSEQTEETVSKEGGGDCNTIGRNLKYGLKALSYVLPHFLLYTNPREEHNDSWSTEEACATEMLS